MSLLATHLLEAWARYLRLDIEVGTTWTPGSAGEQGGSMES